MRLGHTWWPQKHKVALCNGVRGLKYRNYIHPSRFRSVALCNGVRGLK